MKPINLAMLAAVPLALMAVPVTSVPLLAGSAMAAGLSPAVGEPLKAAQAAAKAGNTSAAVAKIDQARSAAKSANERRKVGEMAAYVYTAGRQYAKAATELERLGASPKQLAPLYYQAGQYDKAIDAAKKSGQTTIVAQSYLKMGKTDEAARMYGDMVKQNPNNVAALQNLAGIQYKTGDRKAYIGTITRLLRLDPTPNRWRSVLLDMRGGSQASQLAVYHLMRQTGALKDSDYQDYAKLAILGGQSGAVVDLLRDAEDPMVRNMEKAAQDRQNQALKEAVKKVNDPATALDAGGALFGAGHYKGAISAYHVATKGPKRDVALLDKGISQVKAGDLAGARASFEGVPDDSHVRDITDLWELYLSTKGA